MSTKYAIVGGKLIDGTGAEPVENSLVLVDDNGKIEYAPVLCRTFPRALRLSTPPARPSFPA